MFDREAYLKQPIAIEKELKALFNTTDALTIFEIGACEGEDSIKYARLFTNAKIYAFEPLPQNVAMAQNNILDHNAQNVVLYNKALSLSEGKAEFYISDGRPDTAPESDWDYGNKSSSLLPPDKHVQMAPFIKFDRKIEVETISLENFCREHGIASIDYIHMDVQGAELMVLQGAGKFISQIKVIWLEVAKIALYKDQPLVNDITRFMADNNFVLAKNCLDDVQGDQLYISKAFFPQYKQLQKAFNANEPSLVKKIIKKLGFN